MRRRSWTLLSFENFLVDGLYPSRPPLVRHVRLALEVPLPQPSQFHPPAVFEIDVDEFGVGQRLAAVPNLILCRVKRNLGRQQFRRRPRLLVKHLKNPFVQLLLPRCVSPDYHVISRSSPRHLPPRCSRQRPRILISGRLCAWRRIPRRDTPRPRR